MGNKKILITGGSRGIGLAIARKLISDGHNVLITGRNADRLAKAAKEINACGYIQADKTNKDAPSSILEGAVHILGGIDVLVNNAGVYVWSPIEKTPSETVEELLKVNLQTPYELCRLVVPVMKAQRYGRIINIGSISGAVGEANASLYSLTKAGLIGMTKALALELAEWGITVNTINPGWVKTDMLAEVTASPMCENDENGFSEQEQLDMIPQKRWIEPEEVASLVDYLISDAACGITGQSINLCCGLSLG
jgi:3-hydroxybutyrate dehydrogenase